jgi:hypothetical protein
MLLMPYHRAHQESHYGGLLPDHLSRMRMRNKLRTPHHTHRRLAKALLGSYHNGLPGFRKKCPPRVLFQPLVKGELKANHQCHIHVGASALGLVTCLILLSLDIHCLLCPFDLSILSLSVGWWLSRLKTVAPLITWIK